VWTPRKHHSYTGFCGVKYKEYASSLNQSLLGACSVNVSIFFLCDI
jgi:hypothetical protein